HRSRTAEAASLGAYAEQEPAVQPMELPESSWGQGGKHYIWDNPAVAWMWPDIHAAEVAMEALVSGAPALGDLEFRYLRQAARELLLLQASDWPFLITT